ncbi:polysaccharide lyase family 1 protein [Candidatus Poribacteria bacterium]
MTKRLSGVTAFLLIISGYCSLLADELPAFPGAEGFGAIAVGGRGGKVIKVTNLDSSGPGSLQAACEAEEPRIVVFEVGGVIRGDIAIRHSYITIAGQTAPSPGITVEGRLLARPRDGSRLHDIVVRFLRFRPLPTTGVSGDTVQLPKTERVILDHLSLSWANDETIDIIYSSEVTVQWCAIEESDPTGHSKGVPHNYGILSAYEGSGNISIHHNLFAHHYRRCPSLSPQVPTKPGDFRNNVLYDCLGGLAHDGHTPKSGINLIGNYYKKGPSSERLYPFGFINAGRYYVAGNYIEGIGEIGDPRDESVQFPRWIQYNRNGEKLTTPAEVAPVTTHSAQKAYMLVLAHAGCRPQDRVSLRTIEEVKTVTGKWARNAPAKPSDEWYLEGLQHDESLTDSDDDGMPDAWEAENGCDKTDDADNNKVTPSGYTAIEEYINERAQQLTEWAE